ncbi:MAG: Ig-like domain-containing protein [Syntrophomonadaceae bacterium]|jgi:hypothetical protein
MNFCDIKDRSHHDHVRNRHEDREPIILISSNPRNRQTGVSPKIKSIKLILSHDLIWAKSIEIDMWQGFDKVPIRIKKSRDRFGKFIVVFVVPINSLAGGLLYKVRIKAFFKDRRGEIHKKIQMITFTTGCN